MSALLHIFRERERERYTHELPTPLLLGKQRDDNGIIASKRRPLALLRELSLGFSTTSGVARTDKETIQKASRLRGDFLDDFDGNETALQEKVRYEVYHHQSEEEEDEDEEFARWRAAATGRCRGRFSLLKTAREEEEEEREETEKEATERGSGCAYCAPLGQLPMGTGNEFARVFGWNESKDRWESDFDAFCEEMKTGKLCRRICGSL